MGRDRTQIKVEQYFAWDIKAAEPEYNYASTVPSDSRWIAVPGIAPAYDPKQGGRRPYPHCDRHFARTYDPVVERMAACIVGTCNVAFTRLMQ